MSFLLSLYQMNLFKNILKVLEIALLFILDSDFSFLFLKCVFSGGTAQGFSKMTFIHFNSLLEILQIYIVIFSTYLSTKLMFNLVLF